MSSEMTEMSANELVEAGLVIAWPREHAVDTHPGRTGKETTYIAMQPFSIAGDSGSRDVGPGDVLSASEARTSGTSLARLVSHHMIFPVPSDRGVIGLVRALWTRIERLEQERGAA